MAREMVARATTIEQLRQAQAVVLPLDFGLRGYRQKKQSAV